MTNETTCGPLYKAGLNEFTDMSRDEVLMFTAGFISGQAEKVYIGACSAAMFRPSEERYADVHKLVMRIRNRYGLGSCFLSTSRGREIWLFKEPDVCDDIQGLRHIDENSSHWHGSRARLCGIPRVNVDYHFHERVGYNEPCDV